MTHTDAALIHYIVVSKGEGGATQWDMQDYVTILSLNKYNIRLFVELISWSGLPVRLTASLL